MRKIISIMEDWLFTYSKDQSQIKVNLPHTWNNLDGQDGGNDYYRGACSYKKTLKAPSFDKEKEVVYLQFHGVNASANVIFNNSSVITHDGGYSTFRVNVTDLLKDENELEVIVDNSKSDKVYPQNADFTFYGGIYRDVEWIIVSKNHFDLDYYGGSGIKYYSEIKDGKALVYVDTYTNLDDSKVVIELLDQEGKLVDSKEGKSVVFNLDNPHLWDGIADPYLYKIIAKLYVNDNLEDEVSCNCGIRSFYFDPNKGFFLNCRSYPLYGVSRHQDRKALGNAITKEHHIEDMELIRELGANTIRLAHYQHDQFFYDLCDKYGMVVWAEIPYISEHLPNGRVNTISQMKELIIQNYNHPCIVTWGISNEITIKDRNRKDMLDNHHVLNNLCHSLDKTRPTTLANYAVCTPFHPVTKITDIVAWNLYLGWYVPGLFLNDLFMKFYHFIYPKRCLGYSEYGAEGMPNLHSRKPRRGDHTEEYQAKYHEYMLGCFERHPFLWGTYVWNMFDFAADARCQGGEPGMNHKGLVTFDRKLKKDSFYLYKAYWNNNPMIHIASKRYEYREGKKTTIKVYSNQKEVALYNNGKLICTKEGNKVFTFKLKMSEVNDIKVVSNSLEDNTVIYRVKKRKPEYKLKSNDSKNWM
ncbi:MAG: hypothetical protein J6R47_04035 [Acholeplasmatales bacterium]|nr:hypothetical protein [Acholeplasmatales bacterium]